MSYATADEEMPFEDVIYFFLDSNFGYDKVVEKWPTLPIEVEAELFTDWSAQQVMKFTGIEVDMEKIHEDPRGFLHHVMEKWQMGNRLVKLE